MKLRVFATVGALAIVIGWLGVAVSGQAGYTAPRTPWGDPDIQGLFTTDDELGVPFERDREIGTRTTLTDAEFAAREATAARQAAADAEEFVAPRAPAGGGGGGRGATGCESGGRRGSWTSWALAGACSASIAADVDRHRPARRTDSVSER
jgi:hypothetical protein